MRRHRPAVVFLGLVAVACAPVWAVDYFVTQDGPAHAYTASLMLDLLRGEPAATELVAFNPWTLSNSLGHWLLALLLTAVSPFTATEIMVTLTYVGVVAALWFLRLATAGREGLTGSLLFGAAVGFNWFWLTGLYNFLLGAIGLAVTIGLYYRWHDRFSRARPVYIAALSLLLVAVYLSHLVAFAVLAGFLLLAAVASERPDRRRISIAVVIAFVPVTVLALIYTGPETEPLFPVWRRLSSPWSLAGWITYVRTADPFFILSRRAFPFVTTTSSAFVVFTPLLWLGIAAAALAWTGLRRRMPLVVAFAGCVLAAAFGPDDFGTSHGTLLRERFAFIAAMLFVPLYRSGDASGWASRLAHGCLVGLLVFQTAALWEYALTTSRDAGEFLAVSNSVSAEEPLASVIVLENGARFPSNPMAGIGNFLGIGRPAPVWDNYQFGYTLFPVIANHPADRQLAFDLTSANVLDDAVAPPVRDARLAKLRAFFEANHTRIASVVTWRDNAAVQAVLGPWYASTASPASGRVRVYRHR